MRKREGREEEIIEWKKRDREIEREIVRRVERRR